MPESALVAMSGGVDSAVAALISLEEGLQCAGALMKLHPGAPSGEADALAAAERLGIKLYICDLSKEFDEKVVASFVKDYSEGRTPNPCVLCNKHIKFGALLEKARTLGMELIVTGHYARVERSANGRFLLKKGADGRKDQSYALYTMSQEQLARVRFPLGGLTKQRVREIALEAGLRNAGKGESQDICFVPDGDYAEFINSYTGSQPQKGRFIDADGNDLGENKGIIHYTVGQRRGLELSMPYPPYVLSIRPEDSTVVVGGNERLYSKTLHAKSINLIPFDKLDKPMRVNAKIRYNQRGQRATIRQIDDDTVFLEFDEPQRAITRGQSVVFYDSDIVIGGGTIV